MRPKACAVLWLALATAGCGLHPVELAPGAATDTLVIGKVPDAAIARFAAAQAGRVDPAHLTWLYPADGTVLPQDIAPIAFAWRSGPAPAPAMGVMSMPAMPGAKPDMMAKAAPPKDMGSLLFELRIQAAGLDLRVYSDQQEIALPASRFRALLHEHAGAQLTLSLRALSLTGMPDVFRTDPVHLLIRGPTPAGALYYGATPAAGLKRATLAAERAAYLDAKVANAAPGSPTCTGCHALSRDGRRLLAAAGGTQLAEWSLPDLQPILPHDPQVAAPAFAWGAFDTTASRIATTYRGALQVLDADSGEPLAQASLPAGVRASQPDWSPDGRYIAFALWPPGDNDDQDLNGTSLARVRVALDGTLGAAEMLVEAQKNETLLFPTYSPDGTLIAFEQAKGSAKQTKDATLWLVSADGGTPIQLALGKPMGAHADVMPSWMPADAPDAAWLLFSSTRSYADHALEQGQLQLWAVAIDVAQAASGVDPTHPAFWLPFQELEESNQRVLWAPQPATCVPAKELCDQRDDDCDGKVDEDCCTPTAEICSDGRDDDCDGVADDGCGCGLVDACGDGLDGDCDGQIDEGCPPPH